MIILFYLICSIVEEIFDSQYKRGKASRRGLDIFFETIFSKVIVAISYMHIYILFKYLMNKNLNIVHDQATLK